MYGTTANIFFNFKKRLLLREFLNNFTVPLGYITNSEREHATAHVTNRMHQIQFIIKLHLIRGGIATPQAQRGCLS